MRITSSYGVEILRLHKPLRRTMEICREAVRLLLGRIEEKEEGAGRRISIFAQLKEGESAARI